MLWQIQPAVYWVGMSDVTHLIDAAAGGDKKAAAELLPLVYDELRRLAASRVANEPAGLTLNATALVHEAYLRMVVSDEPARWENRGHFFAAAAAAMRRILVDAARRKATAKRGGSASRIPLDDAHQEAKSPFDMLALNDALTRLAAVEPRKAELVQLRFFAGLSTPEASAALGISVATAERWWSFARTWLFTELGGEEIPLVS